MENQNRTRSKRIQVRFTDEEYNQVRKRMDSVGYNNFEKYMRKLALEGAIYAVDLTEIKAFTLALSRVGTNINQIAKKAQEYRINQTDIAEVQRLMKQLVDAGKAIVQMAIDIHRLK